MVKRRLRRVIGVCVLTGAIGAAATVGFGYDVRATNAAAMQAAVRRAHASAARRAGYVCYGWERLDAKSWYSDIRAVDLLRPPFLEGVVTEPVSSCSDPAADSLVRELGPRVTHRLSGQPAIVAWVQRPSEPPRRRMLVDVGYFFAGRDAAAWTCVVVPAWRATFVLRCVMTEIA